MTTTTTTPIRRSENKTVRSRKTTTIAASLPETLAQQKRQQSISRELAAAVVETTGNELDSRVAGGSGSGRRVKAEEVTSEAIIGQQKQRVQSKHHSQTVFSSMLLSSSQSQSQSQSLSPSSSFKPTLSNITTMSNCARQPQSQCFHYQGGQLLSDNMAKRPVAQQATVSSSLSSPSLKTTTATPPATSKPVIPTTTTTATITTYTSPTTGISLSHLLLVLILTSSFCLMRDGVGIQCVPTKPSSSAASVDEQQQQQQQTYQSGVATSLPNSPILSSLIQSQQKQLRPEDATVLLELTYRPSNQGLESEQTAAIPENTPDDAILLILADQSSSPLTGSSEPQQQPSPSSSSLSPSRRLKKRSGTADQRLAEFQMFRALKKQLERASKLAASNLSSTGQERAST